MTTIQPATQQLLDLAAEMRPGWDRDQLALALVACHNAGWDWTRTLTAAVRLLCDVKAVPHDLAVAARKPTDRVPAPAELTREGAAKVRAALAEALGED